MLFLLGRLKTTVQLEEPHCCNTYRFLQYSVLLMERAVCEVVVHGCPLGSAWRWISNKVSNSKPYMFCLPSDGFGHRLMCDASVAKNTGDNNNDYNV